MTGEHRFCKDCSYMWYFFPPSCASQSLLQRPVWWVDFLVYSIHRAVCLPRCCRGDAGFHVGSLFHTEREGEKWEIIALPASLNLGHRASGGNKPGSFSLWVTVGQDCCRGSLLLSHPPTLTLQLTSLSLPLPPVPRPPLLYYFSITLHKDKCDAVLSVSDLKNNVALT